MQTTGIGMTLALLAAAAGLALSGCERSASSGEAVATEVASTVAAAPADRAEDVPPAAGLLTAQAQPAEAASSRTAATAGVPGTPPDISSMNLAEAQHKMGVPVDLHYRIDGDAKSGQAVTLHLAAVPRTAGSNLVMSIKKESGIHFTAPEFAVQKVSAAAAYRQQLSVSKVAGSPAVLNVLIMMEVAGGSAHGWFRIPLDGAPAESGK